MLKPVPGLRYAGALRLPRVTRPTIPSPVPPLQDDAHSMGHLLLEMEAAGWGLLEYEANVAYDIAASLD